MDKLLDVGQVAKRWRVKRRIVTELWRKGRLPALNVATGSRPVLRFRLMDIEHYEQAQTMPPTVDGGGVQ